jgi:hypothetical protein
VQLWLFLFVFVENGQIAPSIIDVLLGCEFAVAVGAGCLGVVGERSFY